MDKLFFFVTSSKAWDAKYHDFFFNEQHAFLYAFLVMVALGLVFALIFYLGCCNSKNDNKMATLPTWVGFLVVTGLLGYLTANFVFIGKAGAKQNSVFYKHSFYKANETYYNKYSVTYSTNPQMLEQLAQKKESIKQDLNHGKDVRKPFAAGCVVYSLIFFYLFSLIIKGHTRQGVAIPHLWPTK